MLAQIFKYLIKKAHLFLVCMKINIFKGFYDLQGYLSDKLCWQYHPDKNKNNPKAQEQFVKINEAYNVLSKAESRKDYDFNLQTFGDPSKVYRSPNKNDYYEVHRYDSHYRE